MPYFVDGNNLIGLARRKARPGEDDRSALLAELASRMRSNRSTVRVFFDGPGRPAALGPLTVSGIGGNADDAILRELAKVADPGQVTVVTADGELSRRVRETGARTMSPTTFWKILAPRASAEPEKAPAKVDVEEWFEYFSDPKNRR